MAAYIALAIAHAALESFEMDQQPLALSALLVLLILAGLSSCKTYRALLEKRCLPEARRRWQTRKGSSAAMLIEQKHPLVVLLKLGGDSGEHETDESSMQALYDLADSSALGTEGEQRRGDAAGLPGLKFSSYLIKRCCLHQLTVHHLNPCMATNRAWHGAAC